MARQALPTATAVADRQIGWVERLLPKGLWPYATLARWDRPIGAWLLLWPCWWALCLAPDGPEMKLMLLFALGAIAMRGAGCTINDMFDRDLDAKVERTRHRPLASGTLLLRHAAIFLALQLLVGLVVLLQLNGAAILTGLLAMPLVIVYPWMKRVTWWPQLWLGLTFKWGALVGWAAATGSLDPPAFALYAAGIFWTLGYDTIYAHQDRADDAMIGVKSTARRLGEITAVWLWGFYATSLAFLLLAGILAGSGRWFFVLLAPVALHFVWQIRTLDIDDPGNCLRRFRSNRDAGFLVMLALLAGKIAS